MVASLATMQAVGIDLGTTNSLVAYLREGRPEIIANRRGDRGTPSVVSIDRHGRTLVGKPAREDLILRPEWSIAEVKRKMGSTEKIVLGDRTYSPQELSALILRSLREDAEAFLGVPVSEAVVTVPAYFTDAQRQATKDAGELAGLKVERILNEPTAAALAYGIEDLSREELVLVYDLGGGTFDVSVLDMFEGVLDVKASAGNNTLGGGDFDRLFCAWLTEKAETALGCSFANDRRKQALLLAAAERAKIELSATTTTEVCVVGLADQPFELEVSRAEFERLIATLVRSTLHPVESALKDAGYKKEQIAQILLVGGSTRIPLVRSLLAETFGKEPEKRANPDEAVALGAAIQAGLKVGTISAATGIMITDVAPFTLGVETQSRAGSHAVNGVFSAIIERNSTIPIERTETYATTVDGQDKVTIRVFQGESRFTKHNVYLDEYTIEGVPKAPAGREKIAVTFAYDINGILKVTTKIASTGKEAHLAISKSPTRLSAIEKSEAISRLEAQRSTPPLRELAESARKRLPSFDGEVQARLRALLDEADRALASGDKTAQNRLDADLTDFLFSLD
jgi:molecular chaperone DnaK